MKNTIIWIIGIVVILLIIAGTIVFISLPMNSQVNSNIKSNNQIINTNNQVNENTNSMDNNPSPENYNIAIDNFKFSPATMTIEAGESVTWTNKDSVRHTITSDLGNELDSSMINNGESYTHIFNTPGTYQYHCTPHPSMKGTIIVK